MMKNSNVPELYSDQMNNIDITINGIHVNINHVKFEEINKNCLYDELKIVVPVRFINGGE